MMRGEAFRDSFRRHHRLENQNVFRISRSTLLARGTARTFFFSSSFFGTPSRPDTGAMAAYGAPASLVHPDALDEVFDIIDANGDGVLTVNEFIMVRASQIRRTASRSPRDLSSF
jgi:hypothetical protein